MGDTETNVKAPMIDTGSQTFEGETTVRKHCHRNCTVLCKYEGKDPTPRRTKCEWIRCALCAHWFHPECVDLPLKETDGVWSCPICRTIANDVTDLKATVSTLQDTIQTLLEIVRKSHSSIMQINSSLETQSFNSSMLKDMHKDLECVKNSVTNDDDCVTDDEDDDSEPEGTLLITDSLGRDIVSTCNELTVYSEGGANFSTLCKYLKKIKRSYSDLYIVCGTNNCASKKTVEKITDDCKKLLTEAKKHAKNVHIASVLPRKDTKQSAEEKKTLKEKIDTFNQILVVTSQQMNVKYINNDNNFKYRDDTCDEQLLGVDGLHLSAAGVKRLLENLSLTDKAKCKFGSGQTNRWTQNKTVTKPVKGNHEELRGSRTPPTGHGHHPAHRAMPRTPQSPQNDPILFRGHKNPLSNFFPCDMHVFGETVHCSEQAYQLRKAILMKDYRNASKIRSAPTGKHAQDIGKAITTDNTWQDKKKDIMIHILREKLHQCPSYFNALKESKNRPLVEDTNHNYWARGRDNCGQNILGKIHEQLRSEIDDVDKGAYDTNVYDQNVSYNSYATASQGRTAKCWNCAESNHTVKNCRFSYPVECYSCYQSGHKQKFCPRY